MFDIDVKAKKKVIAHLKANFYNKRHIAQESIKNNPNKTPKQIKDNTVKNKLKEGLTYEYMASCIARVPKIKQICHEILDLIDVDPHDKNLIIKYIDSTDSFYTISNIAKSLSVNCFINKKITYESFVDRMELNKEMNNFIKWD